MNLYKTAVTSAAMFLTLASTSVIWSQLASGPSAVETIIADRPIHITAARPIHITGPGTSVEA